MLQRAHSSESRKKFVYMPRSAVKALEQQNEQLRAQTMLLKQDQQRTIQRLLEVESLLTKTEALLQDLRSQFIKDIQSFTDKMDTSER